MKDAIFGFLTQISDSLQTFLGPSPYIPMYFPKLLHLYFIYTVTTYKYSGVSNIRTGILDYPRESFPWLTWPLEIIGFIEALWKIYGGFMEDL